MRWLTSRPKFRAGTLPNVRQGTVRQLHYFLALGHVPYRAVTFYPGAARAGRRHDADYAGHKRPAAEATHLAPDGQRNGHHGGL
uniref:Uncharacterized protein n=1 Tax=Tanacetum cinerariifolium TaxID=118510 RepID=A0A699UML9_TANCI|nr:hypothetical protein [Tanacetum cinerariifolium]